MSIGFEKIAGNFKRLIPHPLQPNKETKKTPYGTIFTFCILTIKQDSIIIKEHQQHYYERFAI